MVKNYVPEEDGKYNGKTMTHMRHVITERATVEIFRTVDRAERMRNDAAMLSAAEKKRQMKAMKARRLAAKSIGV